MAYAFNQSQQNRKNETPVDRRIGTLKNGVEITDDNALMIFKELGFNDHARTTGHPGKLVGDRLRRGPGRAHHTDQYTEPGSLQ
jgi:hypothetical protein